jgi:hypothetical protein
MVGSQVIPQVECHPATHPATHSSPIAGRIFVDHYAQSAMPLLLPAVEEGIFADNWRIRQVGFCVFLECERGVPRAKATNREPRQPYLRRCQPPIQL